jgi:hypothetical protein
LFTFSAFSTSAPTTSARNYAFSRLDTSITWWNVYLAIWRKNARTTAAYTWLKASAAQPIIQPVSAILIKN